MDVAFRDIIFRDVEPKSNLDFSNYRSRYEMNDNVHTCQFVGIDNLKYYGNIENLISLLCWFVLTGLTDGS